MRVLDSLVTILISAGVLSSVNAQDDNPWCQMLSGQQAQGFPQPEAFNCPSDLQRFLRKKCEDNGFESSYDNAKEGLTFFGSCLQFVLNEKQIKSDVDIALSSGKVDSVAKKYCSRVPVLNECIKYAIDHSRSCLSQFDESESLDIVNNITSSFLEFLCENDGDRITTFWTTGGLRCLASKGEGLRNCASNIFGSYIPANSYVGAGASAMGRLANPLILNAEDCNNFNKLQRCARNLLVDCRNSEVSNIFNSAFNSIKNASTCENFPEIEAPSSSEILLYDNETEIVNSTSAPEYIVYGEQDFQDINLFDNDTEILNSTSAPDNTVNAESLKNFIRKKCGSNGGPGAWDNLIRTIQQSSSCLEKLENTLKTDVRIAESQGDLSGIFNMYCRKVRSLKKCIKKVKKPIKSCLEKKERRTVGVLNNVTNSFLEFACEDNAEWLEIFAISGGVECLQSNAEALLDCGKQSFDSYIRPTASGIGRRFENPLIIGIEDCGNVRKYQRCIVKVMKNQCQDTRPAYVVGALIDHLVQLTSCSR